MNSKSQAQMSDADTALTQHTENISKVSIETKLSPFLTMHTTTVLSTKEIYILYQAINRLCFIRCDTKDDLNSILPNVMSIFHLLPTQIKMIQKGHIQGLNENTNPTNHPYHTTHCVQIILFLYPTLPT